LPASADTNLQNAVRSDPLAVFPSRWLVVITSRCIAFFEHCLRVPADRYGSLIYSPAQPKTMQEVITPVVFAAFAVLYLKHRSR
jgi:uncharacterized protein (DUF486 family)